MIASEIRQEAKVQLQGLWASLVPIWFVWFLIMFAAEAIFRGNSTFIGFLVTITISGPLVMGLTRIFLRIYHKEPFELGQLFDGFKEFTRCFTAYLLMFLYIFLWLLLLIVPGIIAALGYSMTFFIMAENPQITASDALVQSKRMMMGHKWELFNLGLSFIGWFILCAFTFGIGLLWLHSYMMASGTIFYHKIKGQQEETVSYQSGKEEIIEVRDENL
jgi:uncharacterized membrane protein